MTDITHRDDREPMDAEKLGNVSRRDFLRITQRFGVSSTLIAVGAAGGFLSATDLARAAESTYEKRFNKEAKHTLKFGAAGFNPQNLLIERAGALGFARDMAKYLLWKPSGASR